MTEKPRIILASIIAPFVVLIIPAVFAYVTMNSNTSTIGTSASDDAPVRSAGILFYFLVPLAYPIVGVIMAVSGFGLLAIKKLSLKNLLIGCLVLSIAVGTVFGLHSKFGLKDQLIGFGIFGFGAMVCLSLGIFSWWYIAYGRVKTE